MENNIQQALEQALQEAPERKFIESVEVSFTICDVDLKNPVNRIQEEVRLPSGRGKPVSIAMFAGGDMAIKAEAAGLAIIDPSTIEDLGGDKTTARKVAKRHDFFLAEIPHMGLVGRYLGSVLGPRGKMPRPVPPTLDPAMVAAVLSDTAVVRSRDRVTFHTAVGTSDQSISDLVENTMAVWIRVISKLERGAGNIRSFYIKTSMGPSVKVVVVE